MRRGRYAVGILFAMLVAGTSLSISGSRWALSQQPRPKPGPSGYHLLKKVILGGEGGWDYLAVDADTHRIFISRGTHVMVAYDDGRVAGDIPNTPGVHGIAIANEFNRGFTSNGQGNSVTVFDLGTLAAITEVKIPGEGPDGIVYDPASKRVFTMNGRSQDATAVDAKTSEVAGTVKLPGRPEFPAADGKGHVFVNIEDKSELTEIDSHSLEVVHTWPLAPCESPSGLAMDTKHDRLAVGCHNQMMAFVDSTNGNVVATVPIGAGVDANRFDEHLDYAYASCGDGTLTIAHEDSPDKFSLVEKMETQRGARTMALDPVTDEVFLVTAEFAAPPAPPSGSGTAPGSAAVVGTGEPTAAPIFGAPSAAEQQTSPLPSPRQAQQGAAGQQGRGGPQGRGGRAQMVPGTFTLLIYGRQSLH
jgi:DNA-binding beta-propeller fold protein YncE